MTSFSSSHLRRILAADCIFLCELFATRPLFVNAENSFVVARWTTFTSKLLAVDALFADAILSKSTVAHAVIDTHANIAIVRRKLISYPLNSPVVITKEVVLMRL